VPQETVSASPVAAYFDELYRRRDRYWWLAEHRYSTNPDDHSDSLLTQMTLRVIDRLPDVPRGRALDLGAGEGADSIRLARLGYDVTAVDISEVGAAKIARFARSERASVRVVLANISDYVPDGLFEIIICNGLLHYIEDKKAVIDRMKAATVPDGMNVISLWSTATPVPPCHNKIGVYCDHEDGVVTRAYAGWPKEISYFERAKPESSHDDMPAHSHSHIKLIARRPR
jgi:tellurite methyltransferase